MRRVILAGLLVMAGPAWGQDAWNDLDRCYVKASILFDDTISDAMSVARVLRFQCHQQEQSIAKTAEGLEALKEPMLMRAASVVLRSRAMAKAEAAKK